MHICLYVNIEKAWKVTYQTVASFPFGSQGRRSLFPRMHFCSHCLAIVSSEHFILENPKVKINTGPVQKYL